MEERIYLGSYEIYHNYISGSLDIERTRLLIDMIKLAKQLASEVNTIIHMRQLQHKEVQSFQNILMLFLKPPGIKNTIRIIIEIFIFIYFLSIPNVSNCQEGKTVDSLFKSLNRKEIGFKKQKGKFVEIGYKDSLSDTTVYVLNDIYYYKVDNGRNSTDIIKINNIQNELLVCLNFNNIHLDLDITDAGMYEINFLLKKFLCIISKGAGLYQSGSYQEINFYVLIDITDRDNPKYYNYFSRCSSIYSFGDFNGDGRLDFLKSELYNKEANCYKVVPYTVKNEHLYPFSNTYLILKKMKRNSYRLIKKRWF